jgi:hypothetical protein
VLDTGLFYAASRFELIEGFPEPATWLETFETDQQDPLTAYSRTLDALVRSLSGTTGPFIRTNGADSGRG